MKGGGLIKTFLKQKRLPVGSEDGGNCLRGKRNLTRAKGQKYCEEEQKISWALSVQARTGGNPTEGSEVLPSPEERKKKRREEIGNKGKRKR